MIITVSAVQIFEISNRIVTSVFGSIRNEHNYSKYSREFKRMSNVCVYSAVVNSGPGPVSH